MRKAASSARRVIEDSLKRPNSTRRKPDQSECAKVIESSRTGGMNSPISFGSVTRDAEASTPLSLEASWTEMRSLKRAAEVRSIAETITDEQDNKVLNAGAVDYERMVRALNEIADAGKKIPLPNGTSPHE
jgi:hypothetical protein